MDKSEDKFVMGASSSFFFGDLVDDEMAVKRWL